MGNMGNKKPCLIPTIWSEAEVRAKVNESRELIVPEYIEEIVADYIQEQGIGKEVELVADRVAAIEESYVSSIGGMTGDVENATDDDIDFILSGGTY